MESTIHWIHFHYYYFKPSSLSSWPASIQSTQKHCFNPSADTLNPTSINSIWPPLFNSRPRRVERAAAGAPPEESGICQNHWNGYAQAEGERLSGNCNDCKCIGEGWYLNVVRVQLKSCRDNVSNANENRHEFNWQPNGQFFASSKDLIYCGLLMACPIIDWWASRGIYWNLSPCTLPGCCCVTSIIWHSLPISRVNI